MLQPVLVVLDVPDGTRRSDLGPSVERGLRSQAFNVKWAIPMAYTLEVPEGAISVG